MNGAESYLYHQSDKVTLYLGDARQVLSVMPTASVDCVVTSPPYWALRDYGTGAWHGGDPRCPHTTPPACRRCTAIWRDPQQGLEPTLDAYLDRLQTAFDEIARVLTPSGTVWLNLADAYTSSRRRLPGTGKPAGKQLLGVPWRTALRLQEHGWILRNAIIWAKTNPMPSSVKDRFTTTYEHLFLLTRHQRYWFDLDAVRPSPGQSFATAVRPTAADQPDTAGRTRHGVKASKHDHPSLPAAAAGTNLRPTGSRHTAAHRLGRNPGDVWTLPTRPYHGAHVAPFPIDLPLRAIAAGCPPAGVVCDPYSGTSTTGLAALRLGRTYIGIDIHPDHHDQALQRMGRPPTNPSRRSP
ncbi:site-specific DNA-methyltransferase [Hamadaea sp. NPDC050747]|uniref:DNA-methyltransferase n=1 Tax=Hamadaea sp. NPDC050747 TaxID=3155789 RepID=UPI0033EA3C6A